MRPFTSVLLVAALVSAAAIPEARPRQTTASPPAVPDDAAAARHAAAMLDAYARVVGFSGALLIARGDRVIYRGAAGQAQPEFNAPNTIGTPFRISSITQLFTVAAVMRLVDQGRLALNDPVAAHLPDWPASHRAITIEHLLTAAPGFKDVTTTPEFQKTVAAPRTMKDLVAAILNEPPTGAPGGTVRATNASYHLLAAIVEHVGGVPYADFLQREFLKPLGLNATRPDDPGAIIAGRALGLTRRIGVVSPAPWFHPSNAVGMADLSSTVDDVFRFTHALLTGHLVSPARLAEILQPRAGLPLPPGAGTPPPLPSVGLALTNVTRPVPLWLNSGSISGFTSTLQYAPDTDTTIVLLSNIGNAQEVGALARGLWTMLSGGAVYVPSVRTPVAARQADLTAIAGTWEIAGAFVVTPAGRSPLNVVARVDGTKVFVRIGPSSETEWLSDGAGRFFLPFGDTQIVLSPDTAGAAQYVTYGAPSAMKKVR